MADGDIGRPVEAAIDVHAQSRHTSNGRIDHRSCRVGQVPLVPDVVRSRWVKLGINLASYLPYSTSSRSHNRI